jgi:hypothetical protein
MAKYLKRAKKKLAARTEQYNETMKRLRGNKKAGMQHAPGSMNKRKSG